MIFILTTATCSFKGNYRIKTTDMDHDYITIISNDIRLMPASTIENNLHLSAQAGNVFEIVPTIATDFKTEKTSLLKKKLFKFFGINNNEEENIPKEVYFIKFNNKFIVKKKNDTNVVVSETTEGVDAEWQLQLTLDMRVIIKTNEFCMQRGPRDEISGGFFLDAKECGSMLGNLKFEFEPVKEDWHKYLKLIPENYKIKL